MPEINPAVPASYDAAAFYRITVKRVVPRGHMVLRPANEYTVTGAVATELGDAVATARLVMASGAGA